MALCICKYQYESMKYTCSAAHLISKICKLRNHHVVVHTKQMGLGCFFLSVHEFTYNRYTNSIHLSLAAAFRRVRPPLAGTLRCRPGAEPHSPLALDPCSTRSAITAGCQPIESMVMGMKRAPYRLGCNTEAQRDIRHAVHHHPTILRYSLLVEDGGSYG